MRILRLQKSCGRLILEASILDKSVDIFKRLQWLPIAYLIRLRKYSVLPDYVPDFGYVTTNTSSGLVSKLDINSANTAGLVVKFAGSFTPRTSTHLGEVHSPSVS